MSPVVVVLIALLAPPFTSSGVERPGLNGGDLPSLTLDQSLERALAQNAELKVTRAQVEVAQASLPHAHAWELPKLRIQGSALEEIPTGQFSWYVGLSWLPPNPWQWKHAGDRAEHLLLASRADLATRSWRVVKELRLAWLDVDGAAAHEALAREATANRARLLELLERRLAQGGTTQVEVNLARLGATDARQDVLRWQSAGLKATQSVAWLVGDEVTLAPMPLPPPPTELPSLEGLRERVERNPKLEALRQEILATGASAETEQASRLPWPEWQVRLRQRVDTTINNDLQLGLAIPLGITPATKLSVIRAEEQKARAHLEAERVQLRAELAIVHARVSNLRERWTAFQQGFDEALSSHAALVARLDREGTLDPTLVLTADRQAIELQHKRIEVQLDLARALVELEGIAGPP